MKYKTTLIIPRIRDSHYLFTSSNGHIMSSVLPESERPGEMAFFRYFDSVKVPAFRVETERFCTLDIYETRVKLYFPIEDVFEVIEIGARSVKVPLWFDAPDSREPKHIVIADVGHVWLMYDELTKADLTYFMATAGSPQGDRDFPLERRTCIGHVRYGSDIPRHERNLEFTRLD